MLKLLLILLLTAGPVSGRTRPLPRFFAGVLPETWPASSETRPTSSGTGTKGNPGSDTLRVMFWNVENFFAPGKFEGHDWSRRRFYAKCGTVAKTILLAGDTFGGVPDLVGLCEVGDASVMKALIHNTPLRKLDYTFVHYDSPDRRGIDCALLYRRSRLRLVSSKPCHLHDGTGAVMSTRDILLAVLEPLPESGGTRIAVLVNHHPSKVGSGSEKRRAVAMARLRHLADSLQSEGISRIIAVGDFNAPVEPAGGISPAASVFPGTIKFQGLWEKIDGCPILEGFSATEHIFAPPHLLERDNYGGENPRRTFSGPRYKGGASDHLPIFLEINPDSPQQTRGGAEGCRTVTGNPFT